MTRQPTPSEGLHYEHDPEEGQIIENGAGGTARVVAYGVLPSFAAWVLARQPAPSEGLRDIERRFWKAESSWADKGSGMTEDQKTGAHMVFAWFRNLPDRAALARQDSPE